MKYISRGRRGSVTLLHTVVIVVLLVMTSLAFMKWAADENHQAEFDLARTQAYYVAQKGIFERSMYEMRTRPVETLPQGNESFDPGILKDDSGQLIGSYSRPYINRVNDQFEQGLFASTFYYELGATGSVSFVSYDGRVKTVERTVKMLAKLRTYASYMYLTHYEMTDYGEIIWFWTPDTLNGRVHSNTQIGIKYSPQFRGPFSCSADELVYFSASPYFAYDPQLGAPIVDFPLTAERLRSSAGGSGTFFDNNNGEFQSRLTCDPTYPRGGGDGTWYFEQWQNGTPYDSSSVEASQSIPMGSSTAIFIEGICQVWGTGVVGGNTVGTSGNMDLMSDITYSTIEPQNGIYDVEEATSILGLISEQDIVIKNTVQNGQGNGVSGGYDESDIVITAALVALGENFTFEHQNDIDDAYYWCDPAGDNAGVPDERGVIYLRGAVTQKRRGYVHRSNCGGTGYDKDYIYDFRLDENPPPAYLEATDESGSALFDIVDWKEVLP